MDKSIDVHVFEALQANAGADFVITLLDAFAEVAPQLLLDLRRTATAADADGFEDAAHTLKSNSEAFGALRLADMAHRFERQGPSVGSIAIEALATELEQTLVALKAMARV